MLSFQKPPERDIKDDVSGKTRSYGMPESGHSSYGTPDIPNTAPILAVTVRNLPRSM